jgi:hypothetical protein
MSLEIFSVNSAVSAVKGFILWHPALAITPDL